MSENIEYLDWNLVENGVVERREYQVELAESCLDENTLVGLPTGTGKTTVAVLAAARRIDSFSGKRCLILAPTKPLVTQHALEFREFLSVPDHEIKTYTGDTRPEKRGELWDEAASVVIATPQVIENDLINGRIDLEDVVYLVFDECHRATGDYSYTFIAEKYWQQASHPLVTGMSASPASNRDDIITVCKNIGVTNIEVFTEDDEELDRYMGETEIKVEKIDPPPELIEARDLLEEMFDDCVSELKRMGVASKKPRNIPDLNKLQGKINENDENAYKAYSIIAQAKKLDKALQSVELEGMNQLEEKLESLRREAESSGGSKAAQRIVSSQNFVRAEELVSEYDGGNHKLPAVDNNLVGTLLGGGQAIIFTDSRDSVIEVTEHLQESDLFSDNGYSVSRFVGQSDREGDPGMSQDEQASVINKFKQGEIDVIVATSVAEEGLDIPSVNLVLFYEPVASAVRYVQRSGRTGRQSYGEIVVLVTKGTREENYYYASLNKQSKMEEALKSLKESRDDIIDELESEQKELSEFEKLGGSDEESEVAPSVDGDIESDVEGATVSFSDSGIDIVVDEREMQSTVVRELSRDERINIQSETLEVGDYIVSEDIGIERKSASDFIDTLINEDRDIFEQLIDLSNAYSYPAIILEESEKLYNTGVHQSAVHGTLAAIVFGLGVYLIPSRSEEETANLLTVIAEREQVDNDKEVSIRGSKSSMTFAEQQEFVVSSILDVGPVTSRNLLNHFGSVRDVFTAEKTELQNVENVGEQTAEKIIDVVSSPYEGS